VGSEDWKKAAGSTMNEWRRRQLAGFCWLSACVALFWQPVGSLIALAQHNDDSSHILLVPFISAWLSFSERQKIREAVAYDFKLAGIVLLPGILLKFYAAYGTRLDSSGSLTVNILSFWFFLLAGYFALFGRRAAGKTWFSFTFLLFAVPLPTVFLDRFIYWLQTGSAAVAEFLFDLSGVPVLREGLIFHLSGINIEVAQECSGIRSSIVLVILAVLVSHFAFSPFWKKAVFVIAGLLVMLIKNGVRIATLTLLANYVNPGFLYGRLHHQGGAVFFLFGLALLVPLYLWLRRGEVAATPQASAQNPAT
jgi:exosortase